MRRTLKDLKPHAGAAAGQPTSIEGLWQNELASTMEITSMQGNQFSGTYASAVSGSGGSITGPLVGTISGNAVSFVVTWPNQSVSAWTGLLLQDGADAPYIYALWHLAETPAQSDNWWESVLTGCDLFVPFN